MGPNKLNWNKDSVNKNAQVIPRVATSNHKSPFFFKSTIMLNLSKLTIFLNSFEDKIVFKKNNY